MLPNAFITQSRTDAVGAGAPASFLSKLSGLESTMPSEPPLAQRRKLWEFPTHLHCSIVGTCLSTTELRKFVAKFKGHELKGLSDFTIHEDAVMVAGHHDAAGRLLHKALNRRHETAIKRFNKAKEMNEVRCLWDEALRSGDIPGASWALLTHAASTQDLIKSAFGRRGVLGPQLEGLGIELPFTMPAVVLAQVFVAGPFYVRMIRLASPPSQPQ